MEYRSLLIWDLLLCGLLVQGVRRWRRMVSVDLRKFKEGRSDSKPIWILCAKNGRSSIVFSEERYFPYCPITVMYRFAFSHLRQQRCGDVHGNGLYNKGTSWYSYRMRLSVYTIKIIAASTSEKSRIQESSRDVTKVTRKLSSRDLCLLFYKWKESHGAMAIYV